MIKIKEEHENYIEIYSDNNKKIYEPKIDIYWNNSLESPLLVDKHRYYNNEYFESELDNDIIEEAEEV